MTFKNLEHIKILILLLAVLFLLLGTFFSPRGINFKLCSLKYFSLNLKTFLRTPMLPVSFSGLTGDCRPLVILWLFISFIPYTSCFY